MPPPPATAAAARARAIASNLPIQPLQGRGGEWRGEERPALSLLASPFPSARGTPTPPALVSSRSTYARMGRAPSGREAGQRGALSPGARVRLGAPGARRNGGGVNRVLSAYSRWCLQDLWALHPTPRQDFDLVVQIDPRMSNLDPFLRPLRP